MNGEIKKFEGVYPVTVMDAVMVGDETSKKLIDVLDEQKVEWNQIQQESEDATKIAEITIGEKTTNVYAPSGGGGGGHNYSYEEQVVGTWVNGKPLYEKTLHYENMGFGNDTTLNIGLPDIEDGWVEGGRFKDGDDGHHYKLPVISGGGWVIYLTLTPPTSDYNYTRIRFRASDSYDPRPYRVFDITIQYTKKTD